MAGRSRAAASGVLRLGPLDAGGVRLHLGDQELVFEVVRVGSSQPVGELFGLDE